MSVLTVIKLVRDFFGVDIHTKVLHPSFLGALIYTSVIAILYPFICKGNRGCKMLFKKHLKEGEDQDLLLHSPV